MRRALSLARRAEGWTRPNSLVGTVIVKDGRLVSQGFHRQAGGPHAEIGALRAAGVVRLPPALWVAGVLALFVAMPALAQSDEEAPVEVLEEITVTARKQEIDIQKAPVAVSVISGTDLEQANVVKLDNFNGYVPSLMITKNDGAGRVVSIRGVGWETAQNLSTQPGVLVYVDGVYLANPLALGLDLGEIERIEVLRGPQGTEFGQGTTGGAINIVTRKPDFGGLRGKLVFRMGTFSLLEGSASVNLPVGNHLAFRVSARKYDRDGFSEIWGGALGGYDLDDANTLTSHVSMEWVPSANLSVRLSGFLHTSEQHGAAQKHIADPNPNVRELTQDYPSTFALDNNSYSAVIDWDTPWGVKIKSLTGFQTLRKQQTVDGDRLTEDLVSVDLTGLGPANFDLLPFWDNNSDAFSQEISVTRAGERLAWVMGLFYLNHKNENFFLEAVGPAPVSQFEEQLNNPSPETLPPFVSPLEFVEYRTVTRKDSAIYGQATYQLNHTWALTLGGRFQIDKSTDEATQFWIIDSEQVLQNKAFTWKLGTDISLTDDNFLYLLVSTGWKNGGNNPGALTGGALDVPVNFEPEEVTAFEMGSKNGLANDRAHLNATFFYYDYENYQFIQEDPIPFSAGTGNIPAVEILGVETEFSWLLTDQLRLDGHVTVLDGEIKSELSTLDVVDFLNSGFGRFTATGVDDRASLRVNLAGNDPPKLADLTSRLLLTHTQVFANASVLTSRLDYIYRGEYQYRVFNNAAVDTVPSYSTVSLFFGYELAGLPLELALNASNLFDEDGVNSRFTNPFGLHTTSEEFIPPREVFVTIRYRF